MRGIAATAIKSAIEVNYTATPDTPFFSFPPIPDGVTELAAPEKARLAGSIATVPILQGTNAQEGRLFSVPYNFTNGLDTFVTKNIGPAAGANVTAIVAAYPVPGTYANNDYAVAQCSTEYVYQCVSFFFHCLLYYLNSQIT